MKRVRVMMRWGVWEGAGEKPRGGVLVEEGVGESVKRIRTTGICGLLAGCDVSGMGILPCKDIGKKLPRVRLFWQSCLH